MCNAIQKVGINLIENCESSEIYRIQSYYKILLDIYKL